MPRPRRHNPRRTGCTTAAGIQIKIEDRLTLRETLPSRRLQGLDLGLVVAGPDMLDAT